MVQKLCSNAFFRDLTSSATLYVVFAEELCFGSLVSLLVPKLSKIAMFRDLPCNVSHSAAIAIKEMPKKL